MLKRYLNTFSGDEFHKRARRFGFHLFGHLFGLLVALFNASNKTFDNQFIALLIAYLIGYSITIIMDNIAGIGRKSPLEKDCLK